MLDGKPVSLGGVGEDALEAAQPLGAGARRDGESQVPGAHHGVAVPLVIEGRAAQEPHEERRRLLRRRGHVLGKQAAHDRASKAGVVMFTKVLAMELGPHRINVNSIAPGMVTLERSVNRGVRGGPASDRRRDSLGPAGSPEDIARAALFLASPFAEYITGEVLSVDGGSGTGRTYLPYSGPTRR